MLKANFQKTLRRFDDWWSRKAGTVLIAADIKRPGPVYDDIDQLADFHEYYNKHYAYLESGSYHGDTVPDMSSYLGPGSLCTFVGATPIYTDSTIWFKEGCSSAGEVIDNCRQFLKNGDSRWYEWSLGATEFFNEHSRGRFVTSMPDLQQNLDILAAVMGPERMFMEIIDEPDVVHEALEMLYMVWEKAFNAHWERVVDSDGYSAYTHYNIIGRGRTSVLQSDISCMMSCDMFNEFEMPYLRRQCRILDNVIFHLDGPGAVRHLDSILSIDEINAVQWVPGAGNPGNADECWNNLYDKITQKGKGLYVFLHPSEIQGFLCKYGDGRILIRSLAESADEQKQLVNKYSR